MILRPPLPSFYIMSATLVHLVRVRMSMSANGFLSWDGFSISQEAMLISSEVIWVNELLIRYVLRKCDN